MIHFRPLRFSDLQLLGHWLAQPHVVEWWGAPLSRPAIEAKYGPRIDGTSITRVFIVEDNGAAIGWAQYTPVSDSAVEIDITIGEISRVDKGVGSRAIRAFAEQIMAENAGIESCVAEPAPTNMRSIRAFEKAGFVPDVTKSGRWRFDRLPEG